MQKTPYYRADGSGLLPAPGCHRHDAVSRPHFGHMLRGCVDMGTSDLTRIFDGALHRQFLRHESLSATENLVGDQHHGPLCQRLHLLQCAHRPGYFARP